MSSVQIHFIRPHVYDTIILGSMPTRSTESHSYCRTDALYPSHPRSSDTRKQQSTGCTERRLTARRYRVSETGSRSSRGKPGCNGKRKHKVRRATRKGRSAPYLKEAVEAGTEDEDFMRMPHANCPCHLLLWLAYWVIEGRRRFERQRRGRFRLKVRLGNVISRSTA